MKYEAVVDIVLAAFDSSRRGSHSLILSDTASLVIEVLIKVTLDVIQVEGNLSDCYGRTFSFSGR